MSKIIKKDGLFITKEKRENTAREIIYYFQNELDQEIGFIAAEDILDFFLQEIGPAIYNRAIEDSKNVLRNSFESLEIDLDVLSNK